MKWYESNMPREKERNKSVYRIRDKRIYIIRYEEYMKAIHSTRENDDKRKERARFDPVLIVRINIIIRIKSIPRTYVF